MRYTLFTKVGITIILSSLLNLIYSSNSFAQYGQIREICKNEDLRASYGFSVEKCSEYIEKDRQQMLAEQAKYAEERMNKIKYFISNERYMLAALYAKKMLPFIKEKGDSETYNSLVEYINGTHNLCNEYAQRLNSLNTNNYYNAGVEIINAFQGNYNTHNSFNNLQNAMEYKRARKKYLYHCGVEE